jgi:hypothetical protein
LIRLKTVHPDERKLLKKNEKFAREQEKAFMATTGTKRPRPEL